MPTVTIRFLLAANCFSVCKIKAIQKVSQYSNFRKYLLLYIKRYAILQCR